MKTPFAQILPYVDSLVIDCTQEGRVVVSIMSKQERPLLQIRASSEDGEEAFREAVREFRNLLTDNGVRLTG